MKHLTRYLRAPMILSVLILLLAALVLLPSVAYAGRDIPTAPHGSSVYDETGLLSQETVDYVNRMNMAMESTGAQIGVVVLDSLQGEDVELFSNEVFRSWGIGDKDKNNGVLLLASMEERDLRIEVGYGLEGAIPDSVAGRIIRNGITPHFQSGKYDAGIRAGVESLVAEIQTEYGVVFDENAVSYGSQGSQNVDGSIVGPIIIVVLMTLIFGKGGRGAIFIPRTTVRRYNRQGGLGGGPGGFGGKGSGGGFGGFGGGSSGGGGASGKW